MASWMAGWMDGWLNHGPPIFTLSYDFSMPCLQARRECIKRGKLTFHPDKFNLLFHDRLPTKDTKEYRVLQDCLAVVLGKFMAWGSA